MEVEDEEPVLPLFLLPRPTLRKREDRSWKEEFVDLMRGNPSPEVAAYHEEQRQYMFQRYLSLVAPLLRAIVAEDNADKFLDLHAGRSQFMGPGRLLYPEILCTMVSSNALRCAKVALEGGVPLAYCRADPNARHSYGFTPLHMAAETFSVPMLNLLFRYGASANIPTKGDLVIENLLPLNVAVENASMHKYLEDHWDHGHPVQNLIFLLALPEMKMFLDTVRLIAKHTDNIVDVVSKYIDDQKLVEAAILLLASQKQLRDSPNKSTAEVSQQNGLDVAKIHVGERLDTVHCEVLAMVKEGKNGKALKMLKDEREKLLDAHALCTSVKKAAGEALLTAHEVSLNGFDIVKGRIDVALDALHHEELAMVKEGENGKVLKTLKARKEVLLTAHALVGTVRKAGEALERYIQTRPRVLSK